MTKSGGQYDCIVNSAVVETSGSSRILETVTNMWHDGKVGEGYLQLHEGWNSPALIQTGIAFAAGNPTSQSNHKVLHAAERREDP